MKKYIQHIVLFLVITIFSSFNLFANCPRLDYPETNGQINVPINASIQWANGDAWRREIIGHVTGIEIRIGSDIIEPYTSIPSTTTSYAIAWEAGITYDVTLFTDSGCANIEFSFTIESPEDYFITTWDTTITNSGSSNASSITIPTHSGEIYNYDVDWENNGTWETGFTGNTTHDFGATSDRIHTIRIRGTFPRIYFSGAVDKDKIISIDQWGTTHWTSMERAFKGCTNLEMNASDVPYLSNVTDMSAMYYLATSVGSVNNSSWNEWDTSGVTNMSYMFNTAEKFNQDIGNWNTGMVTDMSTMFANMLYFNQDIGNWDTHYVINMGAMFANTVTFNQDIGGWDTGSVTYFNYMFLNDTDFNQDIGNWDTGNATIMSGMFSGASNFNQDIGNWNTENVTMMGAMFYKAIDFNQDISNWDTHNVTSMGGMFRGETAFNQNLSTWDTSNVTDMTLMFSGAINFNQDIGNWDTSNVTDMGDMFNGATSFNQDLGSWDISVNSERTNINMGGMFDNSGMSICNYDATLEGWTHQNIPHDITLGALGLYYSDQTSHDFLIDLPNNWTITGDTYDANYAPTFDLLTEYCYNATPEGLPTTSNNNITGTWLPSVIDTSTEGTTDYIFTFEPEVGCESTYKFTVRVYPLLEPPTTNNPIITECEQEPLQTLTAVASVTSPINLVWYDSNVDGNVVVNPTLSTIGTVTYYAEAQKVGCSSETRTPVTLTLLENPIMNSVTDINYCLGTTNEIVFTSNINSVTYNWTNSNTNIGLAASGTGDINFSSSNEGTATITVTAVNETCESTPIDFTITIADKIIPIFNLTTTYCEGETPNTLLDNSNDNIEGTWLPTNIDTSVVGETNYTFTPNNTECTASYVLTVTVNALPTIDTSNFSNPTNACEAYILPDSEGVYYTDDGNGGLGDIITETSITNSQTIHVFVDNGTCTNDWAFEVVIHDLPQVDTLSPEPQCDSYTLPVLTNGDYFTESDGAGTSLNANDIITSSQTLYIFTDNGTCTNETSFEVVIGEDLSNCSFACTEFISPTNGASAVAGNATITWQAVADAIQYSISIGTTPDTYDVVSNLDVGNVTSYTPSTNWKEGVTYYVKITASNGTDVSSYCERLSFTIMSKLHIPNAFTPNGDGFNDTYNIKNITFLYPDYMLYFYDRWGSLVYKGRNGWDGISTSIRSFSKEKVRKGAYYVIIDLGNGETLKQSVVISY